MRAACFLGTAFDRGRRELLDKTSEPALRRLASLFPLLGYALGHVMLARDHPFPGVDVRAVGLWSSTGIATAP